jgi:hypothetical protein
MSSRRQFTQQVRRTAILTVGLAACLIFGIVVLASGDWLPGGIIVAASAAGLAREVPVIRRLCSTDLPPPPTNRKPVS